jgi:hypothetical protein
VPRSSSSKSKKSFTERLSTRFDRLTSARSSSSSRHKAANSSYNRAYQEVYRDHYGNLLLPRVANGSAAAVFTNHQPDPWTVIHPTAAAVSPLPRRTFHNVIPRAGRSGPASSGGGGNVAAAAAAWSGWERGLVRYGGAAPPHPLAGHPPSALNDQVLYGEVLYGDAFQPFAAINSNVCLCEDYLGGTQRAAAAGKRSSGGANNKTMKRCKKCGYDRPGLHRGGGLRRSASDESVNGHYTDPYEYTTSRRQLQQRRQLSSTGQKPVFYDEQDEYDDLGTMQLLSQE